MFVGIKGKVIIVFLEVVVFILLNFDKIVVDFIKDVFVEFYVLWYDDYLKFVMLYCVVLFFLLYGRVNCCCFYDYNDL